MSAETAALLVNLGSPAEPSAAAVRRFLREFLSDPHVITLPAPLRKLLLEFVILPRSAEKTAVRYAKIRTPAGMPLVVETEKLRSRVAECLGGGVPVFAAMRYGAPSLADAAKAIAAAGTQCVFVIPLYPQQAESTRDTAVERAAEIFGKVAPQIRLSFAEPFFAAPGYIAAIAGSVRRALAGKEFDKLVISFHGVPTATPGAARYREQCSVTAELLGAELALPRERYETVFQSKFGRGNWLGPDARERFRALSAEGARRIAVVAPGFVADCIETLEELAISGKRLFLDAGGSEFFYVPCLNDDVAFASFLSEGIRENLRGFGGAAA